jgi:phosphate transport system permease protein
MTATAFAGTDGLRGRRRLNLWGLLAAAAGGVAVTGVLFAVGPFSGRVDFVVTAVALAFLSMTVVSFVVEGRRRAVDRMAGNLVRASFLVALIPLVAVLYYTAAKGIPHWSATFFSHSLAGVQPNLPGGGLYHAMVGTVEQVGLAAVVSVPLGILVAVYLSEYGRGALAVAIRFLVDMMTGIPSIVAGLFIYAFLVLGLHAGFSGFAGSLALAILMLPIVIRSSTDVMALVPTTLREAGYALGLQRWRTIVRIVLPTAAAGITTGVLLAVARVAGETAPLLLTAFDNSYINMNPFHGQQSSISLFIYDNAQQAYQPAIDRAWAAAATLITLIIVLYVIARLVTRRNALAPR